MNINMQDEYIDGYFVSSKTKKIWNIELDMLKLLDDIYKKYSLKYFVAYGTLLGAVRHKGFVPWDDDIDVFMLRDDYNKLARIAPAEIQSPYFFQNVYTDDMVWAISKIRDSRTCAVEFPDMAETFNQGIFIDIFPIDSSGDGTPAMQNIVAIKHDIWKCIYGRDVIAKNINNPDIWKEFLIDKDMALEIANLSYKDAMRCFEDFCLEHFMDSDVLSSWSSEVMNVKTRYKREWFDDVIYMPFCGFDVPVPIKYDEVLTEAYGDWRTPIKGKGCLHSDIVIDPDISYVQWLKEHKKDSGD